MVRTWQLRTAADSIMKVVVSSSPEAQQHNTSWASQEANIMVKSDFPRGFYELKPEILICGW